LKGFREEISKLAAHWAAKFSFFYVGADNTLISVLAHYAFHIRHEVAAFKGGLYISFIVSRMAVYMHSWRQRTKGDSAL